MPDTRRALLISYAYPPISAPGALRVSRFAKYLPDHGWSPTVLTVEGGYSRMKSNENPVDLPGVEVVRVADKPFKTGLAQAAASKGKDKPSGIKGAIKGVARSLMIPDRDRTWIPAASAQAVKTAEEIGAKVVFSSSPTISNHMVAQKVARRFGIPWIADFRDPWTVGAGYQEPAWRRPFDKSIERSIMEDASRVIVVSKFIKSLFDKEYPQHAHKVKVIYNGYDEDDFANLSSEPDKDRFIITYAGSFYGGKRDPRGLLAAIANLKEKGRIDSGRFSLQILGHPEDFLTNEVEKLGITDLVESPGLLPYSQCLDLVSKCSVALLVTFGDALSKGEMTTKFFEYLALNKPMLGLVPDDFELATVMNQYQAGVCFAPQDVAGIETWLDDAITRHQNGESLASGQSAAIEQLSRRHLTAELAEYMDEIANRG